MHPTVRLLAIGALAALAACGKEDDGKLQGYVEGEFVYVASPLAGQLVTLDVQRGATIGAGASLFTLENTLEKAARDEAARKLEQGRANLEDARKGQRPSELDALEAALQQARAASVLSEKELARQQKLIKSGATAMEDFDRARATRDQDQHRVQQLAANLQTAQLGSRADQITAAEQAVKALESALAQAQWNLDQKHQDAPQGGLVFDTLFWPGEWVPAGRPIISLLPPARVKVRAFVPQAEVGALKIGGRAAVWIDGRAKSIAGQISFISPQAEYTPPVIYSQTMREKLVFLVELTFAPEVAATLHPGQPVDVRF